MTKILIDPKFHYHPEYKTIYTKTVDAVKKFPEIKELILSAFHPNKNDAAAYAGTAGKTPRIEFNIMKTPSSNIIYHELYHVIQKMKNPRVKTFNNIEEIEATLLGQARMSPSKVDDNTMPYFKAVPKKKLVTYAKYAAREKAKGNKNYVQATHLKVEADKKKDPNNKEWKMPRYSSKPTKAKFTVTVGGKKYARGHTPDSVTRFLKKNIKPDQQFGNMLENYAYELDDFVKKPSWVTPKTKKQNKKQVVKNEKSNKR